MEKRSDGKSILGRSLHFQMLAVRSDEVFLIPSDRWDKATLLELQKQITDSGDGGKLNAAFQRSQYLMNRLSSLGATVLGSTVELNLPYRDP